MFSHILSPPLNFNGLGKNSQAQCMKQMYAVSVFHLPGLQNSADLEETMAFSPTVLITVTCHFLQGSMDLL